jgi:hypothetical protein
MHQTRWHSTVPVKPIDRGAGNLFIAARDMQRQADGHRLGNRFHALDPPDGCFGGPLLPIAFCMASQGDQPIPHSHANVVCVHHRIPSQLGQHVCLEGVIGFHGLVP